VLTVVKNAKLCELTEGSLVTDGKTGLYSLSCTSKGFSKWVLNSSSVATGLSFERAIFESRIFHRKSY
jgi:hypothetical protein